MEQIQGIDAYAGSPRGWATEPKRRYVPVQQPMKQPTLTEYMTRRRAVAEGIPVMRVDGKASNRQSGSQLIDKPRGES